MTGGGRTARTAQEALLMNLLDELEARSIAILREAYFRVTPLAMLWSMGKDSTALLWLARKAFFGSVPFPVVLLDTDMELPEVYAFRDELVARERYRGIVVGIRRDEQAMRAKERVFSPRLADGAWDLKHQPPELWDVYHTDIPDDRHLRVHPLLDWTEIDVWRYTKREHIPVVPLYFARDGMRYRSLGEKNITRPIRSNAATIDEIIAELESTRDPERAGRTMDSETEDAFERLRTGGYM